jgi:tetratricopeptide (TPR) repeat protein
MPELSAMALRRLLANFAVTLDGAILSTPEAVELAGSARAEASQYLDDNSEVSSYIDSLVALFYWWRSRLGASATAEDDRHLALKLYRNVRANKGTAIPETVNNLLSGGSPPAEEQAGSDLKLEAAAYLEDYAAVEIYYHRKSADPESLDQVIRCLRSSLEASVSDDQWAARAFLLTAALEYRLEYAVNASDLDEAYRLARRAIDVTPQGDARLPDRLSSLAGVLRWRYEITNDISELDEAIRLSRSVLGSVEIGSDQMLPITSTLAVALLDRFKSNGDGEDLDNAIASFTLVAENTPPSHPQFADRQPRVPGRGCPAGPSMRCGAGTGLECG